MSLWFFSKIVSHSGRIYTSFIHSLIEACPAPKDFTTNFDALHGKDRKPLHRLALIDQHWDRIFSTLVNERDRRHVSVAYDHCQATLKSFVEKPNTATRMAFNDAVNRLDLVVVKECHHQGKTHHDKPFAWVMNEVQLPQGQNFQRLRGMIDRYVDGSDRTLPREYWGGKPLASDATQLKKDDVIEIKGTYQRYHMSHDYKSTVKVVSSNSGVVTVKDVKSNKEYVLNTSSNPVTLTRTGGSGRVIAVDHAVVFAEAKGLARADYAHNPAVVHSLTGEKTEPISMLVPDPWTRGTETVVAQTDPLCAMTPDMVMNEIQAKAARFGDEVLVAPNSEHPVQSKVMSSVLKHHKAKEAGLNVHNRGDRGNYGVNEAVDPVLIMVDSKTGEITLKTIVRADIFVKQLDDLLAALTKDGNTMTNVLTPALLREVISALDGINFGAEVNIGKLIDFLRNTQAYYRKPNDEYIRSYFPEVADMPKNVSKGAIIASRLTKLFDGLKGAIDTAHKAVIEGTSKADKVLRADIKAMKALLNVKVAFPGGMIEGKDPRRTLVEEMIEELGLKVDEDELLLIIKELNPQLISAGINRDDTRNTLCSSMGTYAYVIEINKSPKLMALLTDMQGGDDAFEARSIHVNPETIRNMVFSHPSYLALTLAHKIDEAEEKIRAKEIANKSHKHLKGAPNAIETEIAQLRAHIKKWSETISSFLKHFSSKAPEFKAVKHRSDKPVVVASGQLPNADQELAYRSDNPTRKTSKTDQGMLLYRVAHSSEQTSKTAKKLVKYLDELVKRADHSLDRGRLSHLFYANKPTFDKHLTADIWQHTLEKDKPLLLKLLVGRYFKHAEKANQTFADFFKTVFDPVTSQSVQDFITAHPLEVFNYSDVVRIYNDPKVFNSIIAGQAFIQSVWNNSNDRDKHVLLNELRRDYNRHNPKAVFRARHEADGITYKPGSKRAANFESFLDKAFGGLSPKVKDFCKKNGLYTKYIDPNFVGPVAEHAQPAVAANVVSVALALDPALTTGRPVAALLPVGSPNLAAVSHVEGVPVADNRPPVSAGLPSPLSLESIYGASGSPPKFSLLGNGAAGAGQQPQRPAPAARLSTVSASSLDSINNDFGFGEGEPSVMLSTDLHLTGRQQAPSPTPSQLSVERAAQQHLSFGSPLDSSASSSNSDLLAAVAVAERQSPPPSAVALADSSSNRSSYFGDASSEGPVLAQGLSLSSSSLASSLTQDGQLAAPADSSRDALLKSLRSNDPLSRLKKVGVQPDSES